MHAHWLDEKPDLLDLSNAFPIEFPFFLDSAASGPLGSYSMLLYATDEMLVRDVQGKISGPGEGQGFFERLESWFQSNKYPSPVCVDEHAPLIPFSGGWFVYLGYEIAAEVEPCLKLPANESGLPDALARRCPGAIIRFHHDSASGAKSRHTVVIAETEDTLANMLRCVKGMTHQPSPELPTLLSLQAETPGKFTQGVEKILHYLRAGDVFQVNLSRRWTGEFSQPPDPISVYRLLRRHNPAPFAGLMRWGDVSLLSSSPERLVQIRDRKVDTRPIAGTRPRGASAEQDLALSRELIDNVKERAEHIMLIDLERNDLGRVCQPGSVEVNELMVIESYAHVHHIVSNVRGILNEGASPVDTMKAVFPGGTITGCPKVRCMQIIAELEQEGRGLYTGSMGYLGRNGDMDLNILIRSMLVQNTQIVFRTGAGIVADSTPEHELQETQDKARGLLLALEQDGVKLNRA